MTHNSKTTRLRQHWKRLVKQFGLASGEQLGAGFLISGLLSLSTSQDARELKQQIKRLSVFTKINPKVKALALPEIARSLLSTCDQLHLGLKQELAKPNPVNIPAWDLTELSLSLPEPATLYRAMGLYQHLLTQLGEQLTDRDIKTPEAAYRAGHAFIKHQTALDPERTIMVFQLLRAYLPPHLQTLLHLVDYVQTGNEQMLRLHATSHVIAHLLSGSPDALRDAVWNFHQMVLYEPGHNSTLVRTQFYGQDHSIGEFGHYGFAMAENLPEDVYEHAKFALADYKPECAQPVAVERAEQHLFERLRSVHGFTSYEQSTPCYLHTGAGVLFCEAAMLSLNLQVPSSEVA